MNANATICIKIIYFKIVSAKYWPFWPDLNALKLSGFVWKKVIIPEILSKFLACFGYQTAPFVLPLAWTNMVLKTSTRDSAHQPILNKMYMFLQFNSNVLRKPCDHILHACIALYFSIRLLNSIVDTCAKRQCCMITSQPYFTALILHDIL